MYKVFVNDKLIIMSSSSQNENNFSTQPFHNFNILKIIQKLSDKNIAGIHLYSTDLQGDWLLFKQQLNVIPAAGGLVLNDENEVLFIYRNNVWDLPKGKIEQGETIKTAAIREVEEECGIYNLELHQKITTTFHIYEHKGLNLKETHWFLMHAHTPKKLTPQLEEGITEVVFKNESEIKRAFKNTYANIKLVYDTYKEW